MLTRAVKILAFAALPFSVLRRHHRDRASAELQEMRYYALVLVMVLGRGSVLLDRRICDSHFYRLAHFRVSRSSVRAFVVLVCWGVSLRRGLKRWAIQLLDISLWGGRESRIPTSLNLYLFKGTWVSPHVPLRPRVARS